MSFSEELKQELAQVPVKSNCCRKAMLAGMLLNASIAQDAKSITVCAGNEIFANLFVELLRLQYHIEVEQKKVGFCGRTYEKITFFSPAALKLIQSFEKRDKPVPQQLGFSCNNCSAAFLRGAFLDRATVNDPHKSFHLEFLFENSIRAAFFANFLEEIGYPPKTVKRGNRIGLYYKGSGNVEELVAYCGAHHIIFEIMNSRIEREIRNNENRATNCVARNIQKTVAASTKQAEAIEVLMKSGKLNELPKSLQDTARLRFEHPDATLTELVELHSEPITKSGLNHRLEKLMEFAEDYPKGEFGV